MRFPPWRRPPRNREEDLSVIIGERVPGILHLTHNDLDAVGCDAIHRMRYGDITTIFCSVGKFPGILEFISHYPGNGDMLSITDLGFQPGVEPVLGVLRNKKWKVEWRDHHRWQDEEKSAVEARCDLLHVDVGTCATGICARDLQEGDPAAAEVARVVCDYDLWKHEDPRSAVLGLVLQRRKNREYVRDRLVEGVFSDVRIESEYREIRGEMEAAMDRSIRRALIRGNRYRIAFAPLYGYPSETAARMRSTLKTDIEVLVSPGGRCSLRSVPPISHRIAREFSGGGHPHASGGSFPFSFWERIRFRITGRARYFDRFVQLAESLP